MMVDAATWLTRAGHEVTVFVNNHDRTRCFEASRDGTLDVRVRGSRLPHDIAGHLRAPLTLARMMALAAYLSQFRRTIDVVLCDLVPHVVPLLKACLRARILFYCHYPDLLLTPPRRGLYRLYRIPIDALESAGTRSADRVLVNSRFTVAQFRRVFPSIRREPGVLYPGIDCELYAPIPAAGLNGFAILSINRFRSGKKLELAIRTLAVLRERLPAGTFAGVKLVMAGGYDPAFRDSAQTMEKLKALAAESGLSEKVQFVENPTDAVRLELLARCNCVVYTPEYEHFGLVPVEGMASGRPVIAVSNGGPAETIVHGETGFLCRPEPEVFAEAVLQLIRDRGLALRMGENGRRRVRDSFSGEQFARGLLAVLNEMTSAKAGC